MQCFISIIGHPLNPLMTAKFEEQKCKMHKKVTVNRAERPQQICGAATLELQETMQIILQRLYVIYAVTKLSLAKTTFVTYFVVALCIMSYLRQRL